MIAIALQREKKRRVARILFGRQDLKLPDTTEFQKFELRLFMTLLDLNP
jgi:hypothetical protein